MKIISKSYLSLYDSTKALLAALCFYLVECESKEKQNFSEVMKLLKKAEVKEGSDDFQSDLDMIFDALEHPENYKDAVKENEKMKELHLIDLAKQAKPASQYMCIKYYKDFKKAAGDTAKSILISTNVGKEELLERYSDRILSRLFGEFERLDTERNKTISGTGLGLAITKTLVEMMHGTVHADSIDGEGSRFTVRIPQTVLSTEPVGDFLKFLHTPDAHPVKDTVQKTVRGPEDAVSFEREMTPRLLASLRSLGEALKPYFEKTDQTDEDLPLMEQEDLDALYEAIPEFAAVYDQDSILRLFKQAEGYRIPEAEQERFRQIQKYVKQSDWSALRDVMSGI